MKAVMYGAGNIGRGFIGALLSQTGYEVVFVDVNDDVVNTINKDKTYPQEIVGEHGRTVWIKNIRAVDGKNLSAVSAEIASADLLATSVGVSVLEKIVPVICEGLTKRWDKDPDNALDLLICENLMDADQFLRERILSALPKRHKETMNHSLGLVETSIGRMVPVMTEEMKQGDPLRICVEEYDFLPVDRDAFKNPIPDYKKIVPYSPFSFYLERKLYIHNMAHAATAFLGKIKGYTYIDESIGDIYIRKLVEGAMIESAMMISKKYQVEFSELKAHIDDLLLRFQNPYLKDTVDRVGREPLRKLKPKDRLAGALRGCEQQGILPVCLSFAVAAALYNVSNESASELLEKTCHISPDEPCGRYITAFYEQLKNAPEDLSGILKMTDTLYSEIRGPVV
ncbi:mannitol dehydrogenase [Anaerostipes sp.]|uniref:mannitol dehydrogenase family protein n=1 Tax=Anaerostipes sp. TaxID=1872530 RepID=UPI0025B8FBB8|nr:mannitol dehydrogenase [Anaerostipes sp.]MBS7009479.1 mannitol dehydrogenase [Anaerostipes sp.]